MLPMAIPDMKILTVRKMVFRCLLWLNDASPAIVQKWYNLYQRCMKKWIGSAILETRWYNFQPYTPTWTVIVTNRMVLFLYNSLWTLRVRLQVVNSPSRRPLAVRSPKKSSPLRQSPSPKKTSPFKAPAARPPHKRKYNTRKKQLFTKTKSMVSSG